MSEDDFVWDSGRKLHQDLHSKWRPGEPDNENGADCAFVGNPYPVLKDQLCNGSVSDDRHIKRFICQKRLFNYDWQVISGF